MSDTAYLIHSVKPYSSDDHYYDRHHSILHHEGVFLSLESVEARIAAMNEEGLQEARDRYAKTVSDYEERVKNALAIYERQVSEYQTLVNAGIEPTMKMPTKPRVVDYPPASLEEWIKEPDNTPPTLTAKPLKVTA